MKKRVFKIIGYAALVIVFLVGCAVTYLKFSLSSIPLEDIHITATPGRLERGDYLFNHVAGCVSCHSQRDIGKFDMPVVPGTIGEGGEVFDQHRGFPGSYTAANITPYGLGQWTDAEIFRAITSGVSRDGRPLFPIMPYLSFGHADKEDIYSIIAYIRTLKPIQKDEPKGKSDFPMNFIINTMPQKHDLKSIPDRNDSVHYGQYLVSMASCIHCHTQDERGKLIPGMEFAGGKKFPLPTGGTIASANITPDNETGIGVWSRDGFIKRFRLYADSSFHPGAVSKNNFNSVMPWTDLGKMTEQDLSAIYAYMRTVRVVKNKVVKFSADNNNANLKN